ncbi:MAG: Ig-like domain-containing protein, partial [Thermoplasmatota archaeon]
YSDHYSFIRYGFNATFFFEYEFNDYYHSPEDVIENMDLDYCTRVTRLMVGTLAELAELATGDWTPPYLRMDTPAPGRLYFRGQELIPLPFGTTVVVGGLTVTVYAGDNDTGMDRVEFYVDGVLQATDDQDPYQFVWDQPSLFRRTLEAQAYDRAGNRASVTSRIWTFIF